MIGRLLGAPARALGLPSPGELLETTVRSLRADHGDTGARLVRALAIGLEVNPATAAALRDLLAQLDAGGPADARVLRAARLAGYLACPLHGECRDPEHCLPGGHCPPDPARRAT